MIEFLPRWIIGQERPSFYDTESVTALEATARLHGKMNELIEEVNSFIDSTNAKIAEFMEGAKADQEIFESAMRQEFQDFIDVITLKYDAQEARIDKAIEDGLEEIDRAVANVLADSF